MPYSLFATAKQIPASTIAHNAGLSLRRKGNRYWVCCPFHSEKTASLCFFDDGGYKCFGCGASGDSISFAAKLYGLSMLEAAQKITGAYSPARRSAVINVYEWRNQYLRHLHRIVQEANEQLFTYTKENTRLTWDDPLFVSALRAREAANTQIDVLYAVSEEELHELRKEAAYG